MTIFDEKWAREHEGEWWKKAVPMCRCIETLDPGPESDLQVKAQNWMDDHGFPWIHDRSRGKNKPGQILDLYCFLPAGRVVIFEFKAKGKGMSPEQKETYLKLMQLGHEVYECKSFKVFLEIIGG